MLRRKTKKNQAQENMLAEGMRLRTDLLEQRESRCYTLLLKGVLVYLIVMGGMGCYLSALSVECSWITVHMVLLCVSLFCAMLYYSKRWENAGYLLLLIAMAAGASLLRHYINSGFYAVANDLAEEASAFFDSNAVRTYGEQISNRYLAITIGMCYVGSVCCILMNILISRRMQYIIAVPLCIGVLMMPLYFELEPSLLYVSMLFAGLLSAYIIRGNGHYKLSSDNHCYQFQAKRRRITYVYAGRALAGVMAVVFSVCFVVIQLLGIIYPQALHEQLRQTSSIKEASKDTVENISMLGLLGLFNFYPNTGGLTNGTLGGVSAVRLDFEPDLVLEFAPYTGSRMYFKTFTGNEYLPVNNRWSRQMDEAGRSLGEQVDDTTKAMKKRYRRREEQTARGTVKITNKAAATGIYLPYYSEDVNRSIFPGQTQEYTFYPELSGRALSLPEKSRQQAQEWLAVPPQNREVIAAFCRDAGLSPDAAIQDNVQTLAQYFQENIPYTIRPGATPYRKDFVNYFLTENRRGYCAHFASAATLIFRSLGIPARYIEGYAVDPEDISEEGTIEYEEKYEDYYDGYSELGQTAVVSVNATDANAHAWVEVYDGELGWQVVDVTPASDEEMSDNGLWQRILNFLRNSGGDDGQADASGAGDDGGQLALKTGGRVARTAGYAAGGILLLVLLFVAGGRAVRAGRTAYEYHRAGNNDRLIYRYRSFLKRIAGGRYELRRQENYRDQLRWLSEHGYWNTESLEIEDAISLLEQAGFSDRQLTGQEFEQVLSCFYKK